MHLFKGSKAVKLFVFLLLLGMCMPACKLFSLDGNSYITITNVKGTASDCTVCTVVMGAHTCDTHMEGFYKSLVDFTCARPQDFFTVTITCAVDLEPETIFSPNVSLFRAFNRTFSWYFMSSELDPIQLEFPVSGLKQTLPSTGCIDQQVFIISAGHQSSDSNIGTFCQNGSISSFIFQKSAFLSLEVAGGQVLDSLSFWASQVDIITSVPCHVILAQINVVFPDVPSTLEFFSPNYPASFSGDVVMWNFMVPPEHNYTVTFLTYSFPQCLHKSVQIEYLNQGDTESVVKLLNDTQPSQKQGDFQMFLRNCKIPWNNPRTGLTLSYKVSVIRSSHPLLCEVDLSKEDGISLYIINNNKSKCEIKKNSIIQEEFTVPPRNKTKFFIQDCQGKDLLVFVNKTMECRGKGQCPVNGTALTVPSLPGCLQGHLDTLKWHIKSMGGRIKLMSYWGFQQILPTEECQSNLTIRVAEEDDTLVGTFCPGGEIRTIEVHSNISVTITRAIGSELHLQAIFNVSFLEGDSENYIYTINLKEGRNTLLATPSWPRGMKANRTVSWIVSLPPKVTAALHISNLSNPECERQASNITVKTLKSDKVAFSLMQNAETVPLLTLEESFQLYMSSCSSKPDQFGTLAEITLLNSYSLMIIIITAVLPILAIVAAISICLVIRKKKKSMMSYVTSIYSPNGPPLISNEPPDETHIYTTIDYSMVYSHLFPKPDNSEVGDADKSKVALPSLPPVNESPLETKTPDVEPPLLSTHTCEMSDSCCGMVDNDLYSLKSDDEDSSEALQMEITSEMTDAEQF